MNITKDDVYKFSPCKAGTKELIDLCFGDKESLNAIDIMGIDHLDDEYKLWILLRPELIEKDILENIRAKFISLIDQKWLADLCVSCPVYETIGKVARCYDRPHSDTYAELIQIVRDSIA